MLWCPLRGHHSILGSRFNEAEVLTNSIAIKQAQGLALRLYPSLLRLLSPQVV